MLCVTPESVRLEEPTIDEGFTKIKKISFERKKDETYTKKALILDYDGTLRKTKSGNKYPLTIDDLEILPNRTKILRRYKAEGYLLLGVSNQSGIAKNELTVETAEEIFDQTNKLIGIDIEYKVCPHTSFPQVCYCRKPIPGLGVEFIEKYKLAPAQCIMVGDMTTDETFAKRCGFQYIEAKKFFQE